MYTLEKVSFNSEVLKEGYFRPESPWLPGTRKVTQNSVELTSFTASTAASARTSISVNHLIASWSGESDKLVLNGISFDLDEVGPV